jgi:MOSC domain-containing protein YiiM
MTPIVHQISISSGGLPKRAVPEAAVTPLGLSGDDHNNRQVHGGPRQAILLITLESIEELKAHGFALYPGALGENITTAGLDRRTLRAGQRYRVGSEAIIELTKPRAPCANLKVYETPASARIGPLVYDRLVKAGDTSSPVWALGGFYASVISTGTIRAGDPVWLVEQSA